jgi:hypothetical protein
MIVMQEARAFARFLESYRESRVGIDVAPLEVVGSKGSFRFLDSIKKEIFDMLWTILVILLVLWLIGLLGGVGGNLIHLLLVVAVVVLIINLVTGRRAV